MAFLFFRAEKRRVLACWVVLGIVVVTHSAHAKNPEAGGGIFVGYTFGAGKHSFEWGAQGFVTGRLDRKVCEERGLRWGVGPQVRVSFVGVSPRLHAGAHAGFMNWDFLGMTTDLGATYSPRGWALEGGVAPFWGVFCPGAASPPLSQGDFPRGRSRLGALCNVRYLRSLVSTDLKFAPSQSKSRRARTPNPERSWPGGKAAPRASSRSMASKTTMVAHLLVSDPRVLPDSS